MERNAPPKNELKYADSTNHSICEKFDKISFPMGQFNPPQKDEFTKRICNKNCRECPFFGWPMPGPAGRDGRNGKDGTNGTNGKDGADGAPGPTGPQGPPGTFNASSLFVWKADQQTLDPAASAGEIGDAVAFTDSVVGGTALSFTSPAEINILESGYYSIRWEIYKSGYDSAFALFFDPDGTEAAVVPGSNYGALSHDERYSGQAIGVLTAGGTLTLNCISTIYPQTIQNEISDDVLVTGASIVIIKIS